MYPATRSMSRGYPKGGTWHMGRRAHGGIAQLGERLHGMQEVSGSIPLTSTKRQSGVFVQVLTLSSRGLGHHPFTVSTGVRIPVGSPRNWHKRQHLIAQAVNAALP